MQKTFKSPSTCGSKTLKLLEETIDTFEAECITCGLKKTIKKSWYSAKDLVGIRKGFLNAQV